VLVFFEFFFSYTIRIPSTPFPQKKKPFPLHENYTLVKQFYIAD
jgi:hypothetical protein